MGWGWTGISVRSFLWLVLLHAKRFGLFVGLMKTAQDKVNERNRKVRASSGENYYVGNQVVQLSEDNSSIKIGNFLIVGLEMKSPLAAETICDCGEYALA